MKKNELKFTIDPRWVQSTPEFICAVEHNLDLGPDIEWLNVLVQAPVINDNETGYAKEIYGGGLLPLFGIRQLKRDLSDLSLFLPELVIFSSICSF